MLVPGVSGGSMAMILGIYDKLITSVSSFLPVKKRNALFLLLFALGGGAGMLLFANPLLYLLERYPRAPLVFHRRGGGKHADDAEKAQIHSVSWRLPVFLVVGFSAVALFSILPAADASGAEKSRRACFDLRRPGRGLRFTCSSGHQRILSSSHDGHVQCSHPIHQQPPLSALSAPSWCGRAFWGLY